MEWLTARLREDTTRSALGQLGVVLALIGVALGVDVTALLAQAEAHTAQLVAITGAGAAVAAQLARIITPDRPPAGADVGAKAVEILKEVGRR